MAACCCVWDGVGVEWLATARSKQGIGYKPEPTHLADDGGQRPEEQTATSERFESVARHWGAAWGFVCMCWGVDVNRSQSTLCTIQSID